MMAKLNNDEVHEIKRLMKAWEDGGCSIALTRQLTMRLQKMLNEYFCKGETMTRDISVEKLIKCAEMHLNFNGECGACDYKDYDDCVEVMLRDAITIIKAGYREACKVENRPIDARKEAEPINVSMKSKGSLMPVIEAYSVEWYEEGVTHCPQFTDIENAIKFADAVMHNKPKLDMVTIRRSKW